jgi:Mg-chelatase subunit ChlD
MSVAMPLQAHSDSATQFAFSDKRSIVNQDIPLPPVPDSDNWIVAQGYNSNFTHGGTISNERYGFDLVLAKDDNQDGQYEQDTDNTVGRTVVSTVKGTIVWKGDTDNMVMIRLDDAYTHPRSKRYLFAKYGHLEGDIFDKLRVNDEVVIYQPLGQVAAQSGLKGRHIHFNLFSDDGQRGGKNDRVAEWCRTCPTFVVSPNLGGRSSWEPDGTSNQYYGWVIQSSSSGLPTAQFSISTPHPWGNNVWAYVGEDVEFDGSASSDVNGSIVKWNWTFGDGDHVETTSAKTTHSYSVPGDYTVKLRVTNNEQLESVSVEQSIKILSKTSTQVNIGVPLIIDCTGSMRENDPNNLRKQAAKLFIQQARIGDRIAVICFTTQAYIFADLTEIKSQEDRKTLEQAVDRIFSNGSTDLGKGLQAGYEVLAQDANQNLRKAAIFLTDGEQACGANCPYQDQHMQFAAKGWRVYTVGLGSDQDTALLRRIAQETGGKYYDSPTDSNLQDIYFDLAGRLTGQATLFQRIVAMITGKVEQILHIIPGVPELNVSLLWGNNLAAADVLAANNLDARLRLVDPNGNLIDINDPSIQHQKGSTYEYYRIPQPVAGEWTFEIEVFGATSPVSVTLEASSVDVVRPIVRFTDDTSYIMSDTISLKLDALDPEQPPDVDLEYRLSNDGLNWTEWKLFEPTVSWVLNSDDVISYVFVQVRDAAGNVSEYDVANFIIDTIPPDTVIVSGTSTAPSVGMASFEWFGSDDNGAGEAEYDYAYYLEGYSSAWSEYTPGILETSYQDLPVGSYLFRVRTRDYAGNIDPTPAEWPLNVLAPTSIDDSPEPDSSPQQVRLYLPIVVEP